MYNQDLNSDNLLNSENTQNFKEVTISIASPEDILSWSRGEVKSAETINYRTFKAERNGLFCEKIFGPQKDYECSCGKYKGIRYKGIICEKCGVEVISSQVRRERMGHIKLAIPVSHIWFFKCIPSYLARILDMTTKTLEKILYYEYWIVINPGNNPNIQEKQLLTDDEYFKLLEEGGNEFEAGSGAEALKKVLDKVDLEASIEGIQRELLSCKPNSSNFKKLSKKLMILNSFYNNEKDPSWMILTHLPVLPPNLRPLVPLQDGRFATSDLNDLYRRVINRNNRLKYLMTLNTPDVIIRNEKRMLQEAVDALLDNGRHGRPVLGTGNRQYKSLSDMLKGKSGRFRQNLLGKRVDYSGRSVIVVGPELKLHECGIPKKIALTLFEPFIIYELRKRGLAHNTRSAKKMITKETPEVWDILEEVIKNHPVLLNRAPTLHRLGIQAFEPKLIEGFAIRLHPLVCTAYNADFDGDQMAIHLPLSNAARLEAKLIMLAPNNLFSPSNGKPLVTPSQDLALGCYYLTSWNDNLKYNPKKVSKFNDINEVEWAREFKQITLHTPILFKNPYYQQNTTVGDNKEKFLFTTAGRCLFSKILPDGFGFINKTLRKNSLGSLILNVYNKFGHNQTIEFLDKLKEIGFKYATQSGMSAATEDMIIPKIKNKIITETDEKVNQIRTDFEKGLITSSERHNKIVELWSNQTSRITDILLKKIKENKKKIEINPIFAMLDSGARGSKDQIRQLAGLRGLMAKPSGDIIERPIKSSFKEGLSILEYFISSHGARKGLADTALKTADSGYMTRKLVDVAQEVIISEDDCKTSEGINVSALVSKDGEIISLKERIINRYPVEDIIIKDNTSKKKIKIKKNELITEEMAELIEKNNIESIKVRSSLTCASDYGICSKCYGILLANKRMSTKGDAIGIIAAQSIGEPGTQLTMRTFHVGGTAKASFDNPFITAKKGGIVKVINTKTITSDEGKIICLGNRGKIQLLGKNKMVNEEYDLVPGANILNKEKIKKGEVFVSWDPHNIPIIAEKSGVVEYKDLIEGVTLNREINPKTKRKENIVKHRIGLHPQLIIKHKLGSFHTNLPSDAHIMVNPKGKVKEGLTIARIPRETAQTTDITGGLVKVAELFEARNGKIIADLAPVDGIIEFGSIENNSQKVIIRDIEENEVLSNQLIPTNKRLIVFSGDYIKKGEALTEGSTDLKKLLEICKEQALFQYLINQIQFIYRSQDVEINDKHIEVIIKQMFRKVLITDKGDSNYIAGEEAYKQKVIQENRKLKEKKQALIKYEPILLGVTKSSLQTESFIAAASFQETTKVLTEAAIFSKKDYLKGFKENVIMGNLIPAGTGFHKYSQIEIKNQVQETLVDTIADEKSSS